MAWRGEIWSEKGKKRRGKGLKVRRGEQEDRERKQEVETKSGKKKK